MLGSVYYGGLISFFADNLQLRHQVRTKIANPGADVFPILDGGISQRLILDAPRVGIFALGKEPPSSANCIPRLI
jgi:hypothetical protein